MLIGRDTFSSRLPLLRRCRRWAGGGRCRGSRPPRPSRCRRHPRRRRDPLAPARPSDPGSSATNPMDGVTKATAASPAPGRMTPALRLRLSAAMAWPRSASRRPRPERSADSRASRSCPSYDSLRGGRWTPGARRPRLGRTALPASGAAAALGPTRRLRWGRKPPPPATQPDILLHCNDTCGRVQCRVHGGAAAVPTGVSLLVPQVVCRPAPGWRAGPAAVLAAGPDTPSGMGSGTLCRPAHSPPAPKAACLRPSVAVLHEPIRERPRDRP